MTLTELPQTGAGNRTPAVARRDDQGGVSKSVTNNRKPPVFVDGRSSVIPQTPTPLKADEILAEEEHILECLGAAVIMRWGSLPTKSQRELFEYATALADHTPTAQLQRKVARFLHNRKDNGFRLTSRTPSVLRKEKPKLEVTTEPTAEDSARHLLDIFQTHEKMRAGQILIRGPTRVEFLENDQWHIQHFVAGLQYASQHHWIALPSPTVIRLTEYGLFAYASGRGLPSPISGRSGIISRAAAAEGGER